jgi:fluoroacetyl-CoA thioesterase
VRHLAATPIGMRVTAHAEVTAVDGRTVSFRVWAEDEAERIGEGTHVRVVVNVSRFDARMEKKAAGA